MNVFYCPDVTAHEALLSPEESAHCIRVLRLVKGEKVQVIDGKGGMFDAMIDLPDARQCLLRITSSKSIPPPRNFKLHIAIAPTKSIDRFEWFIEKAVEIGIDIITPLLCQRSERRVLKTDRLHKLIVSTMKQAIIPYRPVLNELTEFRNFAGSVPDLKTDRFIAHCEDTGRKKLHEIYKAGHDVTVLIGPEGDFSPEEIALAAKNGFRPVSLGLNRLRTETAGVVACHTINLLNDLKIY